MSSGATSHIWEAYAIRYARHDRVAHENFLGGDPHDNSPMPIDYFIWMIRSGDLHYVIDTGFDKAMAAQRGREFLKPPEEGLRALGVDPAQVPSVIMTHLHYDHAGNHHLFPKAKYHIQDREMRFSTGRYMLNHHSRMPFEEEDVVQMVRKLYAGRLVFHDGDAELAPGLSLHFVGGHSMGLQMVRIHTRRGAMVLASDAAHYYANLEKELPYPITYNVAEALEGYRRARELADSPDHIIPGHDPLVLEKYPPPSPELKGWIVRLD